MIGYIDGGKGWHFYDPGSKVLLKSGIAIFPYEDKFKIQVPEEEKRATSSDTLNKLINPVQEKGKLSFIVNALRLGDFSGEKVVCAEDKCVETLAQHIDLGAVLRPPKTYDEAMKDRYAVDWREAIEMELGAMNEMKVWNFLDKPVASKPLGLR